MDLPFDPPGDAESSDPAGSALAQNVILVDDEAVVRDVFSRLLSREPDLVVTLCETAEEALEKIQTQKFELLITDKNLPGLGGIELIAEARALRPQMEAIMITGYASAESVIAAMAAGASDYLIKPFDDLRAVRAKIRAALERRVQRAQSRSEARKVARKATEMLRAGNDAPEEAWQRLEKTLRDYDGAARQNATGTIAVIGQDSIAARLRDAGLRAQQVGEESMMLRVADIVVIETGRGDWRPIAERLRDQSCDVLLLAGDSSDIGDLLEAISMRIDLIGFGGKAALQALIDRSRQVLMRRAVEQAQSALQTALAEFQRALAKT